MKYIRMVNEDEKHEIFTFPNSVNHDCMAEELRRIKNKSYPPWKRVYREPISAGFVNSKFECYGESESLMIESLSDDTELLKSQLK